MAGTTSTAEAHPKQAATTRLAGRSLATLSLDEMQELNVELASWAPADILSFLRGTGTPDVVQFTSFGLSGLVTVDLLHTIGWRIPTVFVDTLHHFEETLALKERLKARYALDLRVFGPGTASTREEYEALYGPQHWVTDSELYQYITKEEPTDRALVETGARVWITGRRRSQGDERSGLQILEVEDDGTIKVNPIAWLTFGEVQEYIQRNDVPYNVLVDQGYKSIGDFHSTVAGVTNSGGERAGRWAGQVRTECGMHNRRSSSQASLSPSPPATRTSSNNYEEDTSGQKAAFPASASAIPVA